MKTYTPEAHEAHTRVAEVLPYLTTRFGDHAAEVARACLLGSDQGRLTIPYLTASGAVIDLRSRCIAAHDCKSDGGDYHWKYQTRKHGSTHLYNAQATLTTEPRIAIIEGEIDAITLHHIAGVPAVGVPGAHTWTAETSRVWRLLFEDFDGEVVVVGDGDKAGREFTDTVCAALPEARDVLMPEGHDVNSFWLAHGTPALLAHLRL